MATNLKIKLTTVLLIVAVLALGLKAVNMYQTARAAFVQSKHYRKSYLEAQDTCRKIVSALQGAHDYRRKFELLVDDPKEVLDKDFNASMVESWDEECKWLEECHLRASNNLKYNEDLEIKFNRLSKYPWLPFPEITIEPSYARDFLRLPPDFLHLPPTMK